VEKVISVKVATAVGLGAIIGAGIFVLSGTAIALAGSAALLAFVVVGLIALIVALARAARSTAKFGVGLLLKGINLVPGNL
jgi:L-asparagine transporter-like permease